MDQDLVLIAGQFLDGKIPREYAFLEKYFPEQIQRICLSYSLLMPEPNYTLFRQHTGIDCTDRWYYKLIERANKLIKLHADLKEDIDLLSLEKFQTGQLMVISLKEERLRYYKNKKVAKRFFT